MRFKLKSSSWNDEPWVGLLIAILFILVICYGVTEGWFDKFAIKCPPGTTEITYYSYSSGSGIMCVSKN